MGNSRRPPACVTKPGYIGSVCEGEGMCFERLEVIWERALHAVASTDLDFLH